MSHRSRLQQEAWEKGVVHATLDPRGSGVARLHLVPPKPSPDDPPWLLFINGWHIIPIGSSWANLLSAFLTELMSRTKVDQEIGDKKLEEVLSATCVKMHSDYPRTPITTFRQDLSEIVGIILAIAHGDVENIPPNLQMDFSLRDYARFMSAPHRMDLIVVPMTKDDKWACPLHCLACYAKGAEAMSVTSGEMLTMAKWLRVIDACRAAGIPQLTFTGGEPLTNPDIVELIEYARWHITRLNTSGVLMTSDMARRLADASLDGVQITLYSRDAATHEKLVGKRGAHALTVAGIGNAVAAGLSVSVNTPLVRANADYADTLRFIHSLGVRYVTCSGLIPTGGAAGQISRGKALENAELFEALKLAMAAAEELGMELSFTSPGWLSAEQLNGLGLSQSVCGACLSNMAVTPAGAVVPCQSWLNDRIGLGNILTTPWQKIWDHPDCLKLRTEAAMGENCPLQAVSEVVK